MGFAFTPDCGQLPRPADPERVERGMERFRDAAQALGDADVAATLERLVGDDAMHALLAGVFGNSPFLSQCLARDIAFVPTIFGGGFDHAFETVMREVGALEPEAGAGDITVALRRAKRRMALLTALADLSGAWPLDTVTGRLSAFCGAALSAACRHLLAVADARGILELPDRTSPETGSGFIVLGMGKLGAFELNYSSDIDLVVLFDREATPAADRDGIQQHFVRLTRELVRMMDTRTGEGYVFRTDLRLRPDPGATPVALSTRAAETYYETLGQNWERAAMIKARPVAGDIPAGEGFLETLRPFIWRRHLDFAAIESILSIKRQIHAHKGGSTVAVGGHNIKLGRGGIREIEFFVQTQQLIWGGRDPSLRAPGTLAAIDGLEAAGRIDSAVARDMTAAYRYLRRLEHRLQMIDDQQTHALPDSDEGLDAVAAFMGHADREAFETELVRTLRTVESHYADLFEKSESLSGGGTLVFTGSHDHPDTLETLHKMGFSDPEHVAHTVRNWHRGRYRATRSGRARDILTELMPALLKALSRTANPDAAFRRFDELVGALPSGVQLFSLFQANPPLLDLVAEIAGGSPRLAKWLGQNPLLLDDVLIRNFYDSLPDADEMAADFAERVRRAQDMQDVLDIARRWANDAKFQVGVLILRDLIDIDRADLAFSDIADAAIRGLMIPIAEEFEARHGRCAGDGFAVLALGKMGGRELSATSDLDLVFLYDNPPGAPDASDGAKPLSPPHYYLRLGQRLINALTAATGEGRLYEVDMRLRPSGNAGPLSVSLETFATYQRENAWTWEHLALTRARVVVGAPAFAARIEQEIRTALTADRPADDLLTAVDDMRRRTDAEHRTDNPWNVKHVRGGLLDCEFIAQYLQLRHAHAHPEILDTGTVAAFRNLVAAGILEPDLAEELIDATSLWRRIQGLLRLTLEGPPDPETFPLALRRQLAEAGGAESYEILEAGVRETAARIHIRYRQIIGEPAAAVRASRGEQTDGGNGT